MSEGRGTCNSCQHFAVLEEQCRAHAPQTFLQFTPNGPMAMGAWPPAKAAQWCGEWKRDVAIVTQ